MKTTVRFVETDGSELRRELAPYMEHTVDLVSASVWYNNDPDDPDQGEIRLTLKVKD